MKIIIIINVNVLWNIYIYILKLNVCLKMASRKRQTRGGGADVGAKFRPASKWRQDKKPSRESHPRACSKSPSLPCRPRVSAWFRYNLHLHPQTHAICSRKRQTRGGAGSNFVKYKCAFQMLNAKLISMSSYACLLIHVCLLVCLFVCLFCFVLFVCRAMPSYAWLFIHYHV